MTIQYIRNSAFSSIEMSRQKDNLVILPCDSYNRFEKNIYSYDIDEGNNTITEYALSIVQDLGHIKKYSFAECPRRGVIITILNERHPEFMRIARILGTVVITPFWSKEEADLFAKFPSIQPTYIGSNYFVDANGKEYVRLVGGWIKADRFFMETYDVPEQVREEIAMYNSITC